MPHEAITRVNAIGRRQHMPSTMTYANRHGTQIPDTVADYPTHDEASDSDNDAYSQHDLSDDDSTSSDASHASIVSTASTASSAASDTDSDPNDGALAPQTPSLFLPPPHHPPIQPLIVDVPPLPPAFAAAANPGVPLDAHQGVAVPHAANQGVEDPGVGINDLDAYDDLASFDTPEEDEEHEASKDAESTQSTTESEQFRIAENQGRARAAQLNAGRPQRTTVRGNRYDDFTYTFFDHNVNRQNKPSVHAYVTAQMSAKKGLQVFGHGGASALMKELHQIVVMNVMSECKSHELTLEHQKKKALSYLMFLKEKRCGRIKGRGCADGHKQRLWKTKDHPLLLFPLNPFSSAA